MDNAEEWRDIPHYEGYYQISTLGRVWSVRRQIYLKPRLDKDGYEKVSLQVHGRIKYEFIHRLVALAFIPMEDGKTIVNHKNEIKNDNRVDNLEWCDHRYNANYGTRNERISQNTKQFYSKIKAKNAQEV